MQSKTTTSSVTTKPVKKAKPVKEVDKAVKIATSTRGPDGERIKIIFDSSKKSMIDKLVLHVIEDPVSKLPVRVVYDEIDVAGNKTNRRLSLSKLIYGEKAMKPQYSVGHKNGDVLDFRTANLEKRLFGKVV
jgi:hypothetical protein